MNPQRQLQHVSYLKHHLSNPNLSHLDRSQVLYDLGTAQLHMVLMKPTNKATEPMPIEKIFCHKAIECFKECYRLRFHILIDHALVKEAWWALVRAREVLAVFEESYEEIGGAPAA